MLEKRLAIIISWVFHPLLMPLLGMAMLFNSGTYISYSLNKTIIYITLLVVFVNTFILPALLAVILKKAGYISSIYMKTPQERRFPFLITGCLYYFTYYLLRQIPLPSLVYLMVLGATATVAVALILSFKWKISIHMIGISGVLGAAFGISQRYMVDMRIIISALIIACGLVGFARLKLQEHSPAQVYSGFLIGFLTEYLLIAYY